MRNYAGHRLAPWLAHVMVSRQETARALLTPGEVMQLPAGDELVLVSGLAPIRAAKLRYFEDRNFSDRVCPAPMLADGRYADRPAARTNPWGRFARLPDARLARAADPGDGDEDGGLAQQRHPGLAEEMAATPAPVDQAAQVALDEDDNVAADSRAMDQARGLSSAARAYGLDEGAGRDLIPGL
jgi:type IV secretion system protein VirD4